MASATEQAVKRLEAALRNLEHAVDQRTALGVGDEGLAAEVRALTTDRAQLAESLDQNLARVARLENVNREASNRIDDAIGRIRKVLEADGGGA